MKNANDTEMMSETIDALITAYLNKEDFFVWISQDLQWITNARRYQKPEAPWLGAPYGTPSPTYYITFNAARKQQNLLIQIEHL